MRQKILDWLWNIGTALVENVVPFILILLIGFLAIRIITRIADKIMAKSNLAKPAHGLIRSMVRITLYLVVCLMAASALGIDVTGIIALASVITLSVSLSIQNSLTNVIGGITLLYTKPFNPGDFVTIASESGTVQEVGMAYTKLCTTDNKIIYIPNNAVVSADITNYTVTGKRRLDLTFSASYDSPTQTVIKALYEAAKVPGVLEDPKPVAALIGYGESNIDYTLRVWTATEDYWDVNCAINEKVRETFQTAGIEMSYPQLNVRVEKS